MPTEGLERKFENASDFLDFLSPRHEIWRGSIGKWIFRGQADSDWKLVAAAHRQLNELTAAAKLMLQDLPDRSATGARRHWLAETSVMEWELWRAFVREADRQGISIPGDDTDLRDFWLHCDDVASFSKYLYAEWPPPIAVPSLALAQHYGVPTRLLDWTYDPRVAAYFAAERIGRLIISAAETQSNGSKSERSEPSLPKRLCVWAFNTHQADKLKPEIEVPPFAAGNNVNMRAQRGVLTLLRFGDASQVHSFGNQVPGYEDFVPHHHCQDNKVGLRKLTLPASEAATLLIELGLLGFDAGTMFPGLSGIQRYLEEKGLIAKLRQLSFED